MQSFSRSVLQTQKAEITQILELVNLINLLIEYVNRTIMGKIKDFEELEIWKLSRELVNLVYSDFRTCRDFTFKNQITSAGISVMNNISEGFCRSGDAEFRHFLNISRASCGEVKSMYYIAEDQKYILSESSLDRRSKCQALINATSKLMKYLKESK
jgi:four helix bundle protein